MANDDGNLTAKFTQMHPPRRRFSGADHVFTFTSADKKTELTVAVTFNRRHRSHDEMTVCCEANKAGSDNEVPLSSMPDDLKKIHHTISRTFQEHLQPFVTAAPEMVMMTANADGDIGVKTFSVKKGFQLQQAKQLTASLRELTPASSPLLS